MPSNSKISLVNCALDGGNLKDPFSVPKRRLHALFYIYLHLIKVVWGSLWLLWCVPSAAFMFHWDSTVYKIQ